MCEELIEMLQRKLNKNFDTFIGEKVRQRRFALGMSQSKLASYIGVSFQQVQKYEKGIDRINASMLYSIAVALNVKIQYFVKGFDDSRNRTDSSQDKKSTATIREEKNARDLLAAYYDIHDHNTRKKFLELIKVVSHSSMKKTEL